MIEIFSVNSGNSSDSFNTYKTVRFCALVDHNVILSIETQNDGKERKICNDINACKKKNQCRYFSNEKQNELNYI